MVLKGINIRPFVNSDVARFEKFRRNYIDGDLELPKGYSAPGVETGVAESSDGRIICSLTGSIAAVMDPLIRNPQIKSGPELIASIYQLERTLAYQAQKVGAVDAYIAIPDHLTDYHRIVEKAGYTQTLQHCYVFRRPLTPDTNPLIGPEMEAKRQEIIRKMDQAEVGTDTVE